MSSLPNDSLLNNFFKSVKININKNKIKKTIKFSSKKLTQAFSFDGVSEIEHVIVFVKLFKNIGIMTNVSKIYSKILVEQLIYTEHDLTKWLKDDKNCFLWEPFNFKLNDLNRILEHFNIIPINVLKQINKNGGHIFVKKIKDNFTLKTITEKF